MARFDCTAGAVDSGATYSVRVATTIALRPRTCARIFSACSRLRFAEDRAGYPGQVVDAHGQSFFRRCRRGEQHRQSQGSEVHLASPARNAEEVGKRGHARRRIWEATAKPAGEVTLLLAQVKGGDQAALGRLIPLVYKELRRLAGHYLRYERTGHTLQPTALVHKAYLRLAGQDRADWQNRAQFMGVAAQLMRRILVDYARQRAAAKRTGGAVNLALGATSDKTEEVLVVDEALERLAALDPQQGRVVEMRYFGGLSVEETAEVLGVSPRTVKRDWAMAKGWLRTELADGGLR